MDLQPEAVPETMAEILSVPCRPNDIVSSFMYGFPDHTCFRQSDSGKLGLQNCLVDSAHFICCMTDGHGARCVRAVAFVNTAKIDGEKISVLNLSVRRHCMRHAAVRAAGNNGIKAHPLCPAKQHQILQTGRNLQLCHARPDFFQKLGQCLVCDFLSGFQPANFIGILRLAQFQKQIRCRQKLTIKPTFVGIELLHGQCSIFKARFFYSVFRKNLCDQIEITRRIGPNHQFGILQGSLSCFGIAAVGNEIAVFLCNQHHGIIGSCCVESRGVEAVCFAVDQYRIQPSFFKLGTNG